MKATDQLPVPLELALVEALWPKDLPLICLAGAGPFAILATRFSEQDWEVVAERVVAPVGAGVAAASSQSAEAQGVNSSDTRARAAFLPFQSGTIGILSYDQFAAGFDGTSQAAARPRVFRVEQALVVDQIQRRAWVTGDQKAKVRWELPPAVLAQIKAAYAERAAGTKVAEPGESSAAPLELRAECSGGDYLLKVERALEDIRAGRYYQINLLRYFRARLPPDRRWLAQRLDLCGGEQTALFVVPGLSLASFSPERFVRLTPDAQGTQIETRPIKGTVKRDPDPEIDRGLAAGLVDSEKDRAELNMIVDLLRNDLNQVAQTGSVLVRERGCLLTAHHVHHLEAVITGRLRPGLRLGAMLKALCPGGSITGAPKHEVMQAIADFEQRRRGYFMGHAFYLADDGRFDSSILIRTLVGASAQGTSETEENAYEFAAGSGIVVRSEPSKEQDEIAAKMLVVTADLRGRRGDGTAARPAPAPSRV